MELQQQGPGLTAHKSERGHICGFLYPTVVPEETGQGI